MPPREPARVASSRDNNFNLIRLLAACAVLFSHCYPLAIGPSGTEPLWNAVRMTGGSIAVDVFFVISGYLVTASLLSRGDLGKFLRARALRIYPALWAATLATVFVLAPIASTLSIGTLYSHPSTLLFLAKNLTLLFGVRVTIPGVFESLPYPATINGSLWTLPIEIRLYLALGVLGWFIKRWRGRIDPEILKWAILAVASGTMLASVVQGISVPAGQRTVAMFFAGATFQVFRSRVIWSMSAFVTCIVALLLAYWHGAAFHPVYDLVLAYLVLYLALAPSGPIRRFNAMGDYSYGVYIYAFPVQQIVAAMYPGISPLGMLPIALGLTFALAALSWHFIEEPALRRREPVAASASIAMTPRNDGA